MTCLRLVEPWSESLRTPGHRAAQPVALRHSVFALRGPASCPAPCLSQRLLRDLPLEVCKGSGERLARTPAQSEYSSHSTPRASGPSTTSLAHSSAFSFPGPVVRRAPPDLVGDVRPWPPQYRDVPPCPQRVHLAAARLPQGHPSYGGVDVRDDRDPLRSRLSS